MHPTVKPKYHTFATTHVLRDHIFVGHREFRPVSPAPAQMTGAVPLASISSRWNELTQTSKLRGPNPPSAPSYDAKQYDGSWTTSVSGYFGPSH